MCPSSSAPAAVRRDARVLIVGGGPFQLDAIRAAKRLVREVWVVDRDAGAPGAALADRSAALDFGRPELIVELARRERFDGVLTAASDAAVPAVAACVEACGLSGTDVQTAQRCRDKWLSNQTLERAGLRVPHTRLVTDIAAARDAVPRVGGFPVVIKPRSAAGGRGVTIVHDAAQIAPAFARAMQYARPEQGCLVQEWISSRSIGLEAFLWQGQLAAAHCVSDQYCEGFVSPIGHALPSGLDPATQARVVQSVAEFCRALGLHAGPFNFDLRYSADEVCMLEVNARLGGSSITPLIRTAYGIDLAEAAVLAALGEDPAPMLAPRHAPIACASRLIAIRERPLDRLGPLRLRLAPGPELVALELLAGPSKGAVARVDDWLLLGHCLVRESSAERAIALARAIGDDVLDGASAPALPAL